MASARTIYLFSTGEAGHRCLRKLVSDLSPAISREEIHDFEALKGKLEGGQVEYLLLDGRALGARLLECLGEPEPHRLLELSLAELEKRHVLRVVASTGGNKTRAARILGIDTKTLYNKLKTYESSDVTRRRLDRVQSGSMTA